MKKYSIIVLAALSLLAFTSCEILEGGGGDKNAVDLGLSVKWATCNLGATSPEQSGDFYAWGEITPKTEFKEGNYMGIESVQKKLEPSQDAARVKLGGKWRMPTMAEFKELYEKCEWTLESNGFTVKSKVNGNSIFLPFTGHYAPIGSYNPDGRTKSHLDHGFTWVSDRDSQNWGGYYNKTTKGGFWGAKPSEGMPIRPVSD